MKTYFEYELKSVDKTTNTASFRLSSTNFFSPKPELVEVKYDLLVGADGVNSAVRSEMIQWDTSETPSLKKYVKAQKPESFLFCYLETLCFMSLRFHRVFHVHE